MRISGAWRVCDDQITRPTFLGEIRGALGDWQEVTFLADCGADRTVFSVDVFNTLGFPPIRGGDLIGGIGGNAEPFEFSSVLRMRRIDGAPVSFRGTFAAIGGASVLDMSVLGRDITNLFALVVDRPNDAVCLISRGEVYHA